MIVYTDNKNRCHVTDDGAFTAFETAFFDGKCDTFIEGYCLETVGDDGQKIYPWKDIRELESAQRQYEKHLLDEQQSTIADMESALNKLGVSLNESVD